MKVNCAILAQLDGRLYQECIKKKQSLPKRQRLPPNQTKLARTCVVGGGRDLGFEGVAGVDDYRGVLFDQRPVVAAVVGGNNHTIAGGKGGYEIISAVQTFVVDADAGHMRVVIADHGAFFTEQMNDIECW